jgi:hypothetical protein
MGFGYRTEILPGFARQNDKWWRAGIHIALECKEGVVPFGSSRNTEFLIVILSPQGEGSRLVIQ